MWYVSDKLVHCIEYLTSTVDTDGLVLYSTRPTVAIVLIMHPEYNAFPAVYGLKDYAIGKSTYLWMIQAFGTVDIKDYIPI